MCLALQYSEDNHRVKLQLQWTVFKGTEDMYFFPPFSRTFPFLNIVLACVTKLEHSESLESFLLTCTKSRECSTSGYFPRTGKCRDTLIVIDCKNSWNRWVMGQLSLYSLFNKNNAFSYYPTCTKFKCGRWYWKCVLYACRFYLGSFSGTCYRILIITQRFLSHLTWVWPDALSSPCWDQKSWAYGMIYFLKRCLLS